ncbi:MAG TPA: DUF4097 family beta strand repeat-containing protein [Pyrinomonadaceae bacterium]|nr:DUF4097 family beta strand repeat-containing protein [Pyrinomonadaceae bacterium]
MSWLYTVIFAGLVFSSQSSSASSGDRIVQNTPATVVVEVQDETEKFDKTFPLNSNGRVSLSNVNGSVVVEAWDRNEVKVEYTKIASSKERLSEVEVRIDSRSDYLEIETDYDNWKSRSGEQWKNQGKLQVEFRLMIPRTAFLNEIETVNGSVTVSNFTNFTKISAVNGSVTGTNLRGTVNLETVNGEVVADFDRLESGNKISLSTVNGRVNLTIPSDSNATINADTLNGNISNDLGLPIRKGKYVGRDLYGRIGNGDARIKLDSVNGGLSIRRKSDGKTQNPVVNLLPNKEKDDEDWDTDKDSEKAASYLKMDKDIQKAVKDAEKESAKAIKASQKELEAIQPELDKISAAAMASAADAIEQSTKILNSKEIQEKMREAQLRQQEALARMANADFNRNAFLRIEQKSDSFPVKGTPKITVNAEPCAVKIIGWDKNEVMYQVTQRLQSRRNDPLKITETHGESNVTITVDEPKDNNGLRFFGDGQMTVIEVYVPRKSNLKIRANGEVRLDGVSGEIDLTGTDEAINVRDSDGKLRVKSYDGRIRVIGFKGELTAETNDGDVYLEGDFSKLTGKAGDGRFIITVPNDPDLDIAANIDALTVENLRVPTKPEENIWRFGTGGPKYNFILGDGSVTIRRSDTTIGM